MTRDTRYALKDKVTIVTGAAEGIGKAIAALFVENGARVIIADIREDTGIECAKELGAEFILCDISDIGQVKHLIEETERMFGQLDVMVNNAGINSSRKEDRVTADEYPIETWQRIMDVDLNGTFYCCREAAKLMVKQENGAIVNIASVAGVVALRLQIGFVAAKAAVIKMTEAMACELGPKGIRVNCVSPGSTLTQGTRSLFYSKDGSFSDMADRLVSFIPQGRPGETEEIAEAVAFLASDSAGYINGHNIVIDGGWTSGFNRDF